MNERMYVFLYVYLNVCTCTNLCFYVCMYVYELTYVCMFVYIRDWTYLYMYQCEWNLCVSMYECTFVFIWMNVKMCMKVCIDIQGVPGVKDLTSGECSLGQTIPI